MRNLFIKVCLFVLVLTAGLTVRAQDNTSAMNGTVTDATGAAVTGASVTLVNADRGIKLTQTTSGNGSYRFPNVPPAQGYTATFSRTGFADVKYTNLTLQVGITRTQDAQLVAGSSVSVEVSGSANELTLNTTDASIGNNFDVKMINELPIQNRDTPEALFRLQPGVVNSSVTGARTDQTSVTLDGMDVNDIAAGSGLGTTITGDAPVDSVQEFRGTVAGLPSDLGTGSGGQFQLVTKGGTNKFHGLLYEYHRDTSTSANRYFNNNIGVGRTPLIQNQFGGNIGGPIFRDKLFFFFDFNNSRIIKSDSAERIVPLDSFRNGNVNYILGTSSNNTGTCSFTSRLATTPQCIGTLTPAQVAALDPQHVGFDPAVLSLIAARYPHANDPNYGGADGINFGGFRFTQPTPDFLYNYVARLDYQLTSKQRLFVRGTIQRDDTVYALNAFPQDPLTSPFINRSYGYVISHVWQIGSNKVNQFYFGDTISKVSFPNNYNPTGTNQFTLGALGSAFSGGSSQKRRVPIPEIRDDFNWTLGAHNLGFGGTFKFIKTNSNLVNDFTGVGVGIGGNTTQLNASLRPSNIRGGTTAPSLFDSAFTLALGRISNLSSNYNYSNAGVALPEGTGATRGYRYFQTEAYVGDTWKVTKNLTLTYGVRYQLYSVPYEVHGSESIQSLTFDQLFSARTKAGLAGASGDTVVPFVTYSLGGKANGAGPIYAPSYKDFAPRFAFSYNPEYLRHTVFNGSAALVYDRTVINAVNFIQDQSSFLFQNNAGRNYGQVNANAALLADPRIAGTGTALALPAGVTPPTAPAITKPYTPYVSGTTPYGGSSQQGYADIIDPTLKDPYNITFNAGVQQEFPGHFILRANYAGRLGRRLLAQADASQVTDFRDPASGQGFVQATANLTQQLRAGAAVTNQPFFENQIGAGATPFLVANLGNLIQLGDIADFANALLANGLIPNNEVVGAQFALNPFLTNKGFSSYNGLLVTLSKNFAQGIQFDVNYTWSHSIDNTSAPANYIAANTLVNFICDANNNRSCRGNSDFDVQNAINANFVANLPFGRGRHFLSNDNRLVDELVGGWSVSGVPSWQSGTAFGTVSNAFGASFNEDAPGLFNGNRGAVAAHLHRIGSTVQLFTDPNAAAAAFQGPIGLNLGSRNNLRGPSQVLFNAGLAKIFAVIPERVNLKFRADFFNVLNHPTFALPVSDFTAPNFGSITSVTGQDGVTSRVGQFSLRLEF